MSQPVSAPPCGCLDALEKGQKPYGQEGYDTIEVASPFVRLKIVASGVEITVGNQSMPSQDNHAVIQAMEYGYSERPICRITIHDEAGSAFEKFMDSLLTNIKDVTPDRVRMAEMTYGWTSSSCGGGGPKLESKTVYLMIDHIVCNFEGGKLIYELEMCDLLGRHSETRIADIWGEEGEQNMPIQQAITKLFKDHELPPAVGEVSFKQLNVDGDPEDLKWMYDDSDGEGPKGVWPGNNQDKMAILDAWLKNCQSLAGKGLFPTYDPSEKGGHLIVWESPHPKCGERIPRSPLRTYVVNGGRNSSVLSFNPKIRFPFIGLTNAGGGMDGDGVVISFDGKAPGYPDCETLKRTAVKPGGAEVLHGTPPNLSNAAEHSVASVRSTDAVSASVQANIDLSATDAIEAELVVVGDHELLNSLLPKSQYVEVGFLNPYHIRPAGGCGEWLAEPHCNEILSSRSWLVKGVTHNISAGKFETTLRLKLFAPGVELDVGDPAGGGDCGWTPPSP